MAPLASARWSAPVSPSAVTPKKRILPCSWRRRTAGTTASSTSATPRRRSLLTPRDRVVEVEEVEAAPPEQPEARLDRARDRARHVRQVGRAQPALGAHDHRRAQRAQDGAQVLLRLAAAVGRRGVEVVDAELDRARDARSRSAGSPRTIKPPTSPHPKASAETLSPVLPSVRYSIPSGAEAAAQLARRERLAVDRRPDVEFLRAGERPDHDRLEAGVLHQSRGDLERRGVVTRAAGCRSSRRRGALRCAESCSSPN